MGLSIFFFENGLSPLIGTVFPAAHSKAKIASEGSCVRHPLTSVPHVPLAVNQSAADSTSAQNAK
jgi:hypothetical protein